ncbi:uncharacterized protein LOC144618640 [Crassostrea virginica]
MPKRKKPVYGSQNRVKERERKRLARQKAKNANVTTDPPAVDSSVPRGSVDGAVTAPLSNFLGKVSVGFPLKEEKPLARVRASLREKMHPLAPRLPPPRGSRLNARNEGKAPSSDSPPWVCAPPRAPGPDPVHGSGPAGQAQLEGSREECTSRTLKDEDLLTESKQYSESITNSILNEQNVQETIYDENDEISENLYDTNDDMNVQGTIYDDINDILGNVDESNDDVDVPNTRNAESCNQNAPKRGNYQVCQSVQGSFHQADILFEDNAGTQCVANCLAALSYHILKSAMYWTTMDMNRILMTGDELYTYLQRSSSVNNRYLLVEELPEHFECFNQLYEFHSNESLASVIMADEGLDYAGFNALPLDEALQIALTDTDGCFVCFGGNSMLIGKTENGFFAFDSHSRSSDGMCSVSGKSTRVLLLTVDEVFSHLESLASSLGYSKAVECNLTGVCCKSISIAHVSGHHPEEMVTGSYSLTEEVPLCMFSESESVGGNDELIVVSQQQTQYKFTPLTAALKASLCQNLNVPCIDIERFNEAQHSACNLGTPNSEKTIAGDGNCFFRAISFSITNSEDFHDIFRHAVCDHLRNNKDLFLPFVRNGEQSIDNHLLSSNMSKNGAWATEVEIFGMAHFLNIDIYTFSGGHWLRFCAEDVEPSTHKDRGSIYLNHCMENHYNVVLTVFSENAVKENAKPNKLKEVTNEYKKRFGNRERIHKLRNSTCKVEDKHSSCETRKQAMKRKYQEDQSYREKKLKKAFERYRENTEFQANVRLAANKKYNTDILYRESCKEKSILKYATDSKHKAKVKSNSVKKYAENAVHKEKTIRKGIQKYAENAEYKEKTKRMSVKKYAENEQHREFVRKRSIEKYRSDEAHRTKVNSASIQRYKENEVFRKKKLQAAAEKYRQNEMVRSKTKTSSKNRYASSAKVRLEKKENVNKQRNALKSKLENEDEVVRVFKEKAMEGPAYSCCCCDRLLFENQVQKCEQEMYSKNIQAAHVAEMCLQEKYSHSCSTSCPKNCNRSKMWICYTCHRKILRGDIPAESAFNQMCLDDIPTELKVLNSLEKHLIAMHIPFMKVMALPHGGQQNIHGPVVCVPSNLRKVTKLPVKQGEDVLLRVKLKRKLNYKGYHEYQFVDPKHVLLALQFLKENNEWYKEVEIDTNWKENANDWQEGSENDTSLDNNDQQQIATDTCLQPVDITQEVLDHYFDDIYDIAPGEGNNPVRLLQEQGNEAKAFPHLFPSGRFSWNDVRDTRITLSRYFNNRLMNSDDRFAKDSTYIFFSQFMSDLNQVIEKTQISIRKSVSRIGPDQMITSEMVQDPEILSKLMKSDEALRFMQPIRGTPAYWSSAQKDLFAMLRQLGIPTWFCSFSAAEHRWNDAVATIMRHQNDKRDPQQLDWSEKNEVLRSNPVTVARMFEHRFHVFQNEVILSPSEPIGKIVDYFQRVEFQQRGSPHMHCLYWVENAPKLDEDGEDAVCSFIDKYVSCAVPSENQDLELREIVLAVQQHSKKHSKSCKKKGTECRFNFPRPPSMCTFINEPLDVENQENDDQSCHLKQKQEAAKQILLQVWNEVQNEENESKTTEEMFNNLGFTQAQYEEAHRILSKKRSIVLKRNPSELWTNQYNPCLLRCWDANMDIQFVLDPFSCIVYVISYISKTEREMGMVLKQTKIEAEEGNESARKTLKKIGSAYLNHREVSAQEAVYRVCNLKMKECSRKVVFVPVGDNPTRLTKPLSQLKRNSKRKGNEINDDHDENEDGDDEEIWMTNIVERYENRPTDSIFQKTQLKPPGFDLYETFYENGHVKIRGNRNMQPVKLIVDTNHSRFAPNEDVIAEAQEAFENIGEPEDAWANLCPETERLREECRMARTEIVNENEENDLPDMQDQTNSDVLLQKQPIDEETNSILNECVREGPENILHVYATNEEVNEFNLTMLRKSCAELVEVEANDFTKDTSTGKLTLRRKKSGKRTENGNIVLIERVQEDILEKKTKAVRHGCDLNRTPLVSV